MASFQITPSHVPIERNELNFRGLYAYQTPSGPNPNQEIIFTKAGTGTTAVNNWEVYDGPDHSNAKIVARAQGLHTLAGGHWHFSMSLVFENERFKGSTLQVAGILVGGPAGEWAIVGGTGEFAMATGVIYRRLHEEKPNGNITELTIHGFCPKRPRKPISIGLWGGKGGSGHDTAETPKRLESVTICSGNIVDSIQFSYTDQAGQTRSEGPWGGSGGTPHTIDLASSEFVKEVSGTYNMFDGETYISSLKLVTNIRTWGPWGVESQSGTPFSIPVMSGSAIVGFIALSGKFLNAIGFYLGDL